MLDEFWSTLESLRPQAEMHESTADIIRIRPETVREGVEEVGFAIGAMLGGVQEQVNHIADSGDALLANTVLLKEQAQTAREAETKMRELAAGNELELGLPDRKDTKMIDAMAQETNEEDERLALIARKEAELAALYDAKNAQDEQFALYA